MQVRLSTPVAILLALSALGGGGWLVWTAGQALRVERAAGAATRAVAAGDPAEALRRLQRPGLPPGDARLARTRGEVHLARALTAAPAEREGALAAAADAYREAARLNPLDASLAADLGWVQLMRGDLPAAEAALQRALAGDPFNRDHLYAMGRLRERLQRPQEAAGWYRRALEVADSPKIRARLRGLAPADD